MTDVLPRRLRGTEEACPRVGDPSAPRYLEPGEGFSLDDPTKELLRLLVRNRQGETEEPSQPVDWDAIWSLAESCRSEELALGSAALAAREALAGEPTATPSALLVHSRRSESGPSASPPTVRVPIPGPELPNPELQKPELTRGLRTAVAGATWLRNVGIIIVLFAVWQLWGTGIAEAHSQDHLKAQYALLVRKEVSGATSTADQSTVRPAAALTSATASAPPATLTAAAKSPAALTITAKAAAAPVKSAAASGGREANLYAQTRTFVEAALPGGVLGQIRIPAIGVDRYFVEGVGEDQLQEGPGRYPGSGLPGQVGNLAIAGHRTTYGAPFFELDHVRVGDKVIIDVPEGRAMYTVSQPPFAVPPYDTEVLADYGDARLTLTTCNPPFFATTRLIVVAKLTDWLPTGARMPISGSVPKPGHAPLIPRVATIGGATRNALATAPVAPRPVQSHLASVPTKVSAPNRSGTAAPTRTTAKGTSTGAPVNDASTARGLANEGAGWHFGELPIVFAIVMVLGALGALYGRVAKLLVGASRWMVMVPMWAAGLLVLFRMLGLLLPADL
ncbi:MAG TPA: sortase [Acidimicrobiales bacterium]|nr:sortase [Acidimicrobiales bacterium]